MPAVRLRGLDPSRRAAVWQAPGKRSPDAQNSARNPEKLLTTAWCGDKRCGFIRGTYKVATWNLELGRGGRDGQFEETVEICSYPVMRFGPWRCTSRPPLQIGRAHV